jgi:hypothetical protein
MFGLVRPLGKVLVLVAIATISSAQAQPRADLILTVNPSWEPAYRIEISTRQTEPGHQNFYRFQLNEILGSASILPDPAAERVTDTDACPAALPVLQRLEAISAVTHDVSGFGREEEVFLLEGTGYTLEGNAIHADGQAGSFRISSNIGSPLGDWAADLLFALNPCWKIRVINPPEPAQAAR